ncbi:ABC transporter related protein [Pseudodesulfovibrio aespoeensis Aspo-2]|uniref:ABC transporter related protein n=2 Tax=Desulfovibrionaceae TaxID=194924 RepID=E6VZL0_PSEA9|nr:ABC transporter related protein [Pseudodesulfovibrio aespoeensis Aspo-2]
MAMGTLFVLSGLAESVGAISLIPLLGALFGETATSNPLLEQIRGLFGLVGIEPTLEALLLVLCAAMVCKGGLVFFAFRQAGYIEAEVMTRLRLQLLDGLLGARWPYFASQSAGSLTHALSLETNQAGVALRSLGQAMSHLVQVIAYLGTGLLVSWQLLVVGVFGGALFSLVFRGLVSSVRRAGARQAEAANRMTAMFTDSLVGAKPLKVMGAEKGFIRYVKVQVDHFKTATRQYVVGSSSLVSVQEPSLVLLLALGLYVAATRLSLPSSTLLVMAFFFFRILSRFSSFQQAVQMYAACEGGLLSLLGKLSSITDHAEGENGSNDVVLSRAVTLRKVCVSYGDRQVLRNLDLEVRFGSLTSLCGPSGVGKTTVADVVTGLIMPDSGEVLVDGVPLREIEMRCWRQQIGYVPQELFLFNDSVKNNVLLGRDYPDEEVWEALERAGAAGFVRSCAGGLDFVVGEHGRMLSGGQRQRLMIARALISKPRLLILDEATTGLDAETEAGILESLSAIKGEMMILAISHQPAIKAVSDAIHDFGVPGEGERVTHES